MKLSASLFSSTLLVALINVNAVDIAAQSISGASRELYDLKPQDIPGDNKNNEGQNRAYVRGRRLAYHWPVGPHSSSSKSAMAKLSKPPPVSSKSAPKPKPVPPPVSSKSLPPPVSSKSAPKPKPVAPPVSKPTPTGKGKGKGSWPPPPAGKGKGSWPPPPGGKGKGSWPPPPGGKGKGYWPPPPPEGKGKGYWPPPPPEGKGKGKGGAVSGKGKGYVPPPGKGKGTVPPPGKGKGYYPPGKGKGKGYGPPMEPVCTSFGVILLTEDLVPRRTPQGRTFDNVPLYDGGAPDIIGYYNEELVNLPSEDCVGTASFSFDRNFESQIFAQFTCEGAYWAIVGGTGDYGCAEGYIEIVSQTEIQVNMLLTICSNLCPIRAPSPPSNATKPVMPPRPVMTPTMSTVRPAAAPVMTTMKPTMSPAKAPVMKTTMKPTMAPVKHAPTKSGVP